MKRAMIMAAALLALGACGGDDGGAGGAATTTSVAAPSTTVAAPTTTEAVTTITTTSTTTTAPAATTSTVAPTTTLPTPTGYGLVWQSAVDPGRVNAGEVPRPTGSADGIDSAVDMVIVIPADASTKLGRDCVVEVDSWARNHGGDRATSCLMVQWRFDVAADFRVDGNAQEGGLLAEDLVTSTGLQTGVPYGAWAFPGTVDNTLNVLFAGGDPGSTVRWRTGSNLVGTTTHTYVVPAELPPIYWDT